jgi:hypothetical protein
MTYEKHFEEIQDKAIVISDLIEQIILVDEVIERHKAFGSTGLELNQYIERKDEFKIALNECLMPYHMCLVLDETA